MSVDTSVITNSQSQTPIDPIGAMTKAVTLKDMMLQSTALQRSLDDQTAMREAYKDNMTVGQDGTPSINMGGFTKQLSQQNPMLAIQKSLEYKQNQAAQVEAQTKIINDRHQMASDLAWSVPTDPNVSPDEKQAKYTVARNQAIQNQLPGAADSPEQYPGDNAWNIVKQHTLQASQQATLGMQSKELAEKQQEFTYAKQQEALQNTMTAINGSRQTPDVKQAYLDRYNAQKMLDLVQSAGDPNKLNPNMVQLLSSEGAKIAQGGAPQSEELKNLTPNDRGMLQAKLTQYISNHPEASQQGAFVKVMTDYAKTIQGNASKVIDAKIGHTVETSRPHLSKEDYQNLKSNFVNGNPLAPELETAGAAGGGQDPQVSSWAKQHGLDYGTASTIIANRKKVAGP